MLLLMFGFILHILEECKFQNNTLNIKSSFAYLAVYQTEIVFEMRYYSNFDPYKCRPFLFSSVSNMFFMVFVFSCYQQHYCVPSVQKDRCLDKPKM